MLCGCNAPKMVGLAAVQAWQQALFTLYSFNVSVTVTVLQMASRLITWLLWLAGHYLTAVRALRQALFTLYGFNFPVTVALLQMAVIAPVCYAVARPKLEWALARGTMPLALVNVLNVVCGLVGAHRHGPATVGAVC